MSPSRTNKSGKETREPNRRRFLKTLGVAGIAGLAGCGGDGDGTDSPTGTTRAGTTEGTDTETPSPTATDTETPPTAGTEAPTNTPTETGTPVEDIPEDPPTVAAFDDVGPVQSGATTTLTATVVNPYLFPIQSVQISLSAPNADWTVSATGETDLGEIGTGESAAVSWEVTAPEESEGSVTFSGTVSYETSTDSTETPFSQSITVFQPGDTPQDGLVAYYSFGSEHISDGTISDLSGNGHDASAPSGITYNQDTMIAGPSADLSGVGSILIDDPGVSPESYTVSLWIKTAGTGGFSALFGKAGSFWCGTGSNGEVIRFDPTDGAGTVAAGSTKIDDDSWHHVVYRISQGENRSEIYVDNALDDGADQSPTASSSNPIGIGGKSDQGDTFDGEVAEVRYYGRDLSMSEIAALYQERG